MANSTDEPKFGLGPVRKEAWTLFEKDRDRWELLTTLAKRCESRESSAVALAAMTTYLLCVFESAVTKNDSDSQNAETLPHPLHGLLVEVCKDHSMCAWVRAAATLAIGEIEMQGKIPPEALFLRQRVGLMVAGERKDYKFDPMPGVTQLVSWLNLQDVAGQRASLWALTWAASVLCNSAVDSVVHACSRLLANDSIDERVWAAAAKCVTRIGRRAGGSVEALRSRQARGCGSAAELVTQALEHLEFPKCPATSGRQAPALVAAVI